MSIDAVQDDSFFNVSAGDILGSWVKVEVEKSKNSFDSYKLGMAQQAAINEPEKTSQNTHVNDVTDVRSKDQYIEGVDNKTLLISGALLLAGVVLVAVK